MSLGKPVPWGALTNSPGIVVVIGHLDQCCPVPGILVFVLPLFSVHSCSLPVSLLRLVFFVCSANDSYTPQAHARADKASVLLHVKQAVTPNVTPTGCFFKLPTLFFE